MSIQRAISVGATVALVALAACTPCRSNSDCRSGETCSAGACHVASLCTPGATEACTCDGSEQGSRVCDQGGSSFSACQCQSSACGAEGCTAMPDLVGKDLDQAGQALDLAGLHLPDPIDPAGFIVERSVGDPPVQVLEQFPVAGAQLARGSSPVLRVRVPPDQEELGLPNSHFLVGKLVEDTQDSALSYYDVIDPGAEPTRSTLADWKASVGFGQPSDDEASAIYVNHTDLGFGRHMHMRRKGSLIAFYVDNYPTVDDAIANTRFFATVAMEWSPPAGNPSGQPFTKFFVFNKKGQRITDPALDSFGKKLSPGVCLACHGGGLTDLTYASNGGDVGAHFVPFDLDGLAYSTRPGYTRADQEAAFKKLNEAVRMTYPPGDPAYLPDGSPVPDLIDGWYGGPSHPNATFDGTYVPPGWRSDDDGPSLYLGVVARTCRGCHAQREAFRDFSTYDNFWGKTGLIRQRIFEEGVMPLSEKGNLNFWLSYPQQPTLLAKWLGLSSHAGPGKPVARASLVTSGLIRPGQTVQLDGSPSQFSDSYAWSQTGGPAVVLTAAGPRASFVAPAAAGTVQIQLVTSLGAVPSAPVVVPVSIVDVPGVPTGVSAVAGIGSMSVSWTAPAATGNSPLAGYTVVASPGGASLSLGPTPTSAQFSPLNPGVSYSFVVTATNAAGLTSLPSAPSAPVRVPNSAGAPGNVTAVGGNTTALVGWTAPASDGGSPVIGYLVTSAPGGFTAAAGPAATSATVSGLSNGTSYTFTVIAQTAVGPGAASLPSPAVTPATLPGAPTSVSAVGGNAQATVSFTAPASNGGAAITSYVVTSAPGGFSATAGPSATGATVTGLANGTSYTFTVVAVNRVGSSAPSGASNPVVPATLPGAPSAVSAVDGNASAVVSWTAPAANGAAISGYTITSSADATHPGGVTATSTCATATCSATVAGLTNGTSYTFTVTATNVVGTGGSSAPSNAVTPATSPGVPSGVSALAGNASATVSWTIPANNGAAITGWVVSPSPSAGSAATPVCGATTCTSAVSGLANGTSYTFTVAARNRVGTGTPSTASNPVVPATLPGAPSGVSAVDGNASAVVSWTAPASNGAAITGYTITSSADATHPSGVTASSSCATASCNATVAGLTNGTSYTFTVTATNSVGTGSASPQSNAVTPAAVPGAPGGVSATGGNASAAVSWTIPAANGAAITGYVIAPTPSAGSAAAPICGTTTCTSLVSGLANGTSYTFTVAAKNRVGTGSPSLASNAVIPATVPDAPSSVTASPGSSAATVSWSAPASNGSAITSYTIAATPGPATATSNCATASCIATVSPLTDGTNYTFTVTATNGVGPSAPSSPSNAVSPQSNVNVPSAPQSVTAVGGTTSATVTWTTPTNAGAHAIASYKVTASPGGAQATVTLPAALQATVSGLAGGLNYTFDVTATNSDGTGPAGTSNSVPVIGPPQPPTAVSAMAGDQQATVTWTPPTNNGGHALTGYTITSNPSGGTPGAPSCGATCTAVVSTLVNGTSYTFSVTANSDLGSSAAGTSSAVVPAGVPFAPTGVVATRGDQSAGLAWNIPGADGSAITGWNITGGGTVGSISCGATSCTTTITGLTNGTPYSLVVKAINAVGTGAGGTSNSVTPAGVPATPTGVSASGGDTTATVSWTAPGSNGSAITGYSITGGGTVGSVTCPSTCSAPITGLTNGTTYSFTVKATNTVGTGAGATSNPVVPAGVPFAPTGVSASQADSSSTVSWTIPGSNGSTITSWNIAGGGTPGTVACGATTCSVAITGLSNGTSYSFTVKAINGVGTGAGGTSNTVTPAGVPGTPGSVSAAGGNTTATVSWTAPGNNGSTITGYTITGGGTPGTPACVALNCSASVTGLTNGTTYSFTVKATNAAGTGAGGTSNSVVPAGPPFAPTIGTATAGAGQATVTWTAPGSNGSAITSYTLTATGGATFGPVLPANCPNCSVAFTGLTNCTAYSFQVKATNAAGTGSNSGSSNTVTPMQVPDAPAQPSLSFPATFGARMTVSWTAPNAHSCPIDDNDVFVSGNANTGDHTSLGAVTQATLTGLTTCLYPSGACGSSSTYTFWVRAHNAAGWGGWSASNAAVPKTSYVSDNLHAIFTKSYGSGTCTGCHSGHTPDLNTGSPAGYVAAFNEGALIYQCPTNGCGTIMQNYNLFSIGSTEYNDLVSWVNDGRYQ